MSSKDGTRQVQVKVTVKPFQVPNFIVPDKDEDAPKGLPLHALSHADLDAMVAEWIVRVYEKAGRTSPWFRGDDVR